MPRVLLLPPTLVNKIAAGEVVVRPASVVKELVENSLDAGARQVDIEVTNACRDIIVTDDGCGMERDDAEMALVRHATSKIASLDDLTHVRSAGFRGEAVPSIASVSRMRILTRPPDALSGTLIEIEGGAVGRIEVHAAGAGTRIEVRDLFHNVPARLKFLKSPTSELGAIAQIVVRLALARPDVGFTLFHNGRERVRCRRDSTLEERFVQLLGARFRGALLPLEGGWTLGPESAPGGDYEVREGEDADGAAGRTGERRELRHYRVTGLLAQPAQSAKDRGNQFLFANRRPIAHRRFGFVLAEACKGYVMAGRHPVAAVFVEVPAGDLDVNVHPTKEEVRFAREENVLGLIYRATKGALERASLVPEAKLRGAAEAAEDDRTQTMTSSSRGDDGDHGGAPRTEERRQPARVLEGEKLRAFRDVWFGGEAPPPPPRTPAPSTDLFGARATSPPPPPSRPTPAPLPPEPEDPGRRAEHPFFEGPPPRVLGQISDSYIVAETPEGALIVDQHAAHERLLYHRLQHRVAAADQQPLLIPIMLDIPAAAIAAMELLVPPLQELGFRLEPFGGATWQVTAIPADLPDLDVTELLADLLADIEREGAPREIDALRGRVAARLACKAAVKANHTLAHAEMERLLADMRAARLPYTCPHGRPTMILLTRGELDAQFKRR